MRLLLPKAKKEQQRWQQVLSSWPGELVFIDPWLLDAVPETTESRHIWLNLDKYAGIICVSPSAAECIVDALDRYWPMPPMGIQWLCNGPRTAQVLESAGLEVTYPNDGYTAENVLSLPQTKKIKHDHWLIVKGRGGRVTYSETLSERGANVAEIEVYTRSINDKALIKMEVAAQNSQAIWLSSEFLGASFISINKNFWRNWSGQWWVSSERLGKWAREAKLNNVKVIKGATPEALAQFLAESASGSA